MSADFSVQSRPADGGVAQQPGELSGPATPAQPAGRGVLVVEDSPIQATVLRRVLQGSGFEVATARDGAEALTRLGEHPAGVIVADVCMPRMSGHELCQAVKADPKLCRTPVLLLTTLASPEDLMRGLAAGADAYLTKPYDHSVLVERVSALIGQPAPPESEPAATVDFAGAQYQVTATRQRIFNMLLSTYENAAQQNRALSAAHAELVKLNRELEQRRAESEQLLLNVLPASVAEELAAYGRATPEKLEDVTVMFTDFHGFTAVAETTPPGELVHELEVYIEEFDRVAGAYGIERLKSIGDGCLFVAGAPTASASHALDCVRVACELQRFVEERAARRRARGEPAWRMRVGVHSGPVVAGVMGRTRFAYDVWGDTVNVASRMESAGEPGRVNISAETFQRVQRWFDCTPRGERPIKNRGHMAMFFVEGMREEYRSGDAGEPNARLAGERAALGS